VRDALTVDMKDWYHVLYYEPVLTRDDWDHVESRIEDGTRRTLDLLDRVGATATFFVLGWMAERRPDLVREIDRRGHEIGSHWHRLVHTMSRGEFAADLRRSADVLTGITGKPVRGYRAPSFSVTEATPWVFEELAAAGFDYDSSIMPMPRYYGGIPDAPRRPYRVKVGGGAAVREFPVPTARVFGQNVCFAGGGYFRALPARVIETAFARLHRRGLPGMVYFHPWELDPDPPRIQMGWRERAGGRFSNELFRRGIERKLERVLRRFSFAPMSTVLDATLPGRATA